MARSVDLAAQGVCVTCSHPVGGFLGPAGTHPSLSLDCWEASFWIAGGLGRFSRFPGCSHPDSSRLSHLSPACDIPS